MSGIMVTDHRESALAFGRHLDSFWCTVSITLRAISPWLSAVPFAVVTNAWEAEGAPFPAPFVCFRLARVNLDFPWPTVIFINGRDPLTWRP